MKTETLYKTGITAGGAMASYLFGGWSALLGILLVFVAVDYFTGMTASGIEGKLSSSVGAKGIAKKVTIFLMVAIAHMIDTATGDAHVIRDATIFFYLANELLSILENVGRIGLPLPPKITEMVAVLQGKGNLK